MYAHVGYVMAGAPSHASRLARDGVNDSSASRFDLDYWFELLEYELRDERSPGRHFWMAHDLALRLHQWIMTTMKLPTPTPVTHDGDVDYAWWVNVLAPATLLTEDSAAGADSVERMTPWVNALYDINQTLLEIDQQLEYAVRDGWEIVPGTRSETWTLELVNQLAEIQRVAAAIEAGINEGNAAALAEVRRHASEIGADKAGLELYGHTLDRMYHNVETGARQNVIIPLQEALEKAKDDLAQTVKDVGWLEIAKIAVPLGLGIVLLHKMR